MEGREAGLARETVQGEPLVEGSLRRVARPPQPPRQLVAGGGLEGGQPRRGGGQVRLRADQGRGQAMHALLEPERGGRAVEAGAEAAQLAQDPAVVRAHRLHGFEPRSRRRHGVVEHPALGGGLRVEGGVGETAAEEDAQGLHRLVAVDGHAVGSALVEHEVGRLVEHEAALARAPLRPPPQDGLDGERAGEALDLVPAGARAQHDVGRAQGGGRIDDDGGGLGGGERHGPILVRTRPGFFPD